jgi:hypothetical protein
VTVARWIVVGEAEAVGDGSVVAAGVSTLRGATPMVQAREERKRKRKR